MQFYHFRCERKKETKHLLSFFPFLFLRPFSLSLSKKMDVSTAAAMRIRDDDAPSLAVERNVRQKHACERCLILFIVMPLTFMLFAAWYVPWDRVMDRLQRNAENVVPRKPEVCKAPVADVCSDGNLSIQERLLACRTLAERNITTKTTLMSSSSWINITVNNTAGGEKHDKYLRAPRNVRLHESIPVAANETTERSQEYKDALKAAVMQRPIPFVAGPWGEGNHVRISDDGTEVTFKLLRAGDINGDKYPMMLLFTRELLKWYQKIWTTQELSMVGHKVTEALLWRH
jgi:hypothetical protein